MQPSPARVRAVPTGRSMADAAIRHGAIDLAQGVLHTEPPKILIELLSEVAREPHAHAYASPQGVPAYLDALLDLLAAEVPSITTANLLGSSGNTGGLLAALLAHCRAGDLVLLPEPFYPAHLWAIRAARCKPLFFPHGERFAPAVELLPDLLRQARAALICNPANPSGTVWLPDTLRQLLAQAAREDVLLIVDETYKDYVWNGEWANSLKLTDDWSHLVVLRSFSKTHAVAGWRVGYTISAPERIAVMTHQIHDALYVGAPSLPQHVFARALGEHRAELQAYLQKNIALYRENRTRMADVFRSIGMEPHLPQGTFYMLVKHRRADDMTAMRELLNAGVAVAPGVPFFADQSRSSGYIRIHFAVARETVEEVQKRLVPLQR